MKKISIKQVLLILLGVACVVAVVWDTVNLYQIKGKQKALEEMLWQDDAEYTILRELDSYEALQEPFAAQPEVFFPEEPDESVTKTKLYALLAGAGEEAEPGGYGAGYCVEEGRAEIQYSRVCSREKAEIDTDTHYCGILYRFDASEGYGELCFSFHDFGYSLRYMMETKGLNGEEIKALEEKAKKELLETMHDIIDQYAEALKEKYRSEGDFNLTPEEINQKTYLLVAATGDFVVVNAEGESFALVDGYGLGTMYVYGIDFMTDTVPLPYTFLVDHSESFTCIATEEDSRIMEFLASGEKASGFVAADEGEAGWKRVTFDDQEHIYREP